jgi:hypothetical protein
VICEDLGIYAHNVSADLLTIVKADIYNLTIIGGYIRRRHVDLKQLLVPNDLRFCCRGVRHQPSSLSGRIYRAAGAALTPR